METKILVAPVQQRLPRCLAVSPSRGTLAGPTPGWARTFTGLSLGLMLLAALGGASSNAQSVAIPNASFELPTTDFADPRVDSWVMTAKPDWYDEALYGPWYQLTGVFKNVAPEDEAHIDNVDGQQALFLFANPQVGLYQDFVVTSVEGAGPEAVFDARFEVGNAYRLTVGVLGGLGGMLEGTSLSLGLYYLDADTNQVALASTEVVYTSATFPGEPHLVDFHVELPTVAAEDAWAGRYVGIELLSTVDPSLAAGGYWDLDHVRLMASSGPVLRDPTVSEGHCEFVLESDVGLRFEIIATSDLGRPRSEWDSLGIVTNETGRVLFTDPDPVTSGPARFYQARQIE